MTAPATQPAREPSEYERFRHYITTNDFLQQVAPFVGGEAQAKTFVRVVLNAVQKTPDLLSADRRSLLLSCMQAARDKLMPDGKEAVLNIYNTKVKRGGRDEWVPTVQYLPMVQGLTKKLYESGHVKSMDSAAVYKADVFEYERGDSPRIVHRPNLEDEPGPIIAAYVVIRLTSGEVKREVIPKRDIEKIRAASKAPDSPAWKNWPDQMAIKAVIKRAYKQVPSSVEVDQVIAADNDALGFEDFSAPDAFQNATAVDAINAEVRQVTHAPGVTVPPMGVPTQDQQEPAKTDAGDANAAKVGTDAPSDAALAQGRAALHSDPQEKALAQGLEPSEDMRPKLPAATVHERLEAAAKKGVDALQSAAADIELVVSQSDRKTLAQKYINLLREINDKAK